MASGCAGADSACFEHDNPYAKYNEASYAVEQVRIFLSCPDLLNSDLLNSDLSYSASIEKDPVFAEMKKTQET
ncbi:hypothetical protein KTT_57060 [Tengunoibacter tsumagoiensis]|uniref:Uncharacterized protein n=1 Tax=Tengunoibacter tsumagoiensis TaxID=2014871 RepID=A0A402A9J7_9CHLR|nr:hypothetical protein KTT_57060 [Tengunoibacter tsumagoiensis]